MAARSSLLRRPTPGARPARRTSSLVAALAALAPRLVRLAHHGYPDRLLGAPEDERHVVAAEAVGRGERGAERRAPAGDADQIEVGPRRFRRAQPDGRRGDALV